MTAFNDIARLWRYNRPQLANKLVDQLASQQRIALFGPRQTGKTSLLREEVMPLAQERGLLAVYIDCWADKTDPLASMNYALQKAIEEASIPKTALGKLLSTPVKKFGAASASLELGEASKRGRPSSQYLLFDALLIELLQTSKRKVALIFDEFQAIALDKQADVIAAALRASLTQASKRVGVVFSGSSEQLLLEMFSRAKTPLYGFANPEPYPLLDAGFIGHVGKKFKAATGRELVIVDALEVFALLGHQPEPFLHAVSNAMTNPKWGVRQGMKAMLDPRVQNKWTINWHALTPVQQVALKLVFDGKPATAKDSLEWAKQVLHQDKVQPSTMQRALEALALKGLIEPKLPSIGKGYRISDPVMQAWLSMNSALLE
jgi:hypothetical protein